MNLCYFNHRQVPPSTQRELKKAKGTHPMRMRSLSGFSLSKIGGFVCRETSS